MKTISKVVEILAVIIIIFLTGLICLQVILRNFFETGFVWCEEMSRFLLLSLVLITAPLVFFHGKHVRFDMVVKKGSRLFKKIHGIILVLLVIFFYGFYIVSHLILMKNNGNVLSPSLSIPNSIFFGSGLVGAILAGLFGIDRLIKMIREWKK